MPAVVDCLRRPARHDDSGCAPVEPSRPERTRVSERPFQVGAAAVPPSWSPPQSCPLIRRLAARRSGLGGGAARSRTRGPSVDEDEEHRDAERRPARPPARERLWPGGEDRSDRDGGEAVHLQAQPPVVVSRSRFSSPRTTARAPSPRARSARILLSMSLRSRADGFVVLPFLHVPEAQDPRLVTPWPQQTVSSLEDIHRASRTPVG